MWQEYKFQGSISDLKSLEESEEMIASPSGYSEQSTLKSANIALKQRLLLGSLQNLPMPGPQTQIRFTWSEG